MVRIFREYIRWQIIRVHRRELDDLLMAQDYILRDIGVSRGEVMQQRIATRILF